MARRCLYPGCQKTLTRKQKVYCSVAHIPHEKRVANGRASRIVFAANSRERLFGDVFRQFAGRCVTREELRAAYRVVYERGRRAGDMAGFKRGFKVGQQAVQHRSQAA